MPHARLTHPTRGTLQFRQGQSDADRRDAVSNIAPELGVDRPPLVHVETRERDRSITGRVTAPRRAANDSATSDWEQALANYVAELEAHVDEFQGSGYTFEQDLMGTSTNAVYHGLEWTLTPGLPHELDFTCELTVGRGVFDERPLTVDYPTVNSGMDVAGRVDGNDLDGMRLFKANRSFGYDPNPVYNKSSAENNDIVATGGVTHEVTFEGTHTGDVATRKAADDALEALIGAGQVTFETRFPGYSLDGFVLGYESNFENRHGASQHQYTLRFLEGTPG